jgi:hypothetical protein
VWRDIPDELRETVVYEPKDGKLAYTIDHQYLPDMVLANGIHVEVKGHLDPDDRRKMIAVKKAHPNIEIRFVFQRAHNPLRKGAKMTYSQWADREGFKWAEGYIPESWYAE